MRGKPLRIYTHPITGVKGDKFYWGRKTKVDPETFARRARARPESAVPFETIGLFGGEMSRVTLHVEHDGKRYGSSHFYDKYGLGRSQFRNMVADGATYDEVMVAARKAKAMPIWERERYMTLYTNPFTGQQSYKYEWAELCNTTEESWSERYHRLGPNNRRTWEPVKDNRNRGLRHEV